VISDCGWRWRMQSEESMHSMYSSSGLLSKHFGSR